jgi:hypothetical protein
VNRAKRLAESSLADEGVRRHAASLGNCTSSN